MRKIYRKIILIKISILLFLRRMHLLLKYEGLIIDNNSKIYTNNIICTKGSSIIIRNSIISYGTKIIADHGGIITISNSYIGDNCVIVAREKIEIKKHCQIAEMVVIRDQNHNYGKKDEFIKDQGFSTAPIIINENVWIAAKATILNGVEIGENSVIAAHSVVNNNVESNSIYAGIPAKKIKNIE